MTSRRSSTGRRVAGVIALALVGLVMAAGITFVASRLVSEPIGLSGQPGDLGTTLAPAAPAPTSPTLTRTTVRTVTTTALPPHHSGGESDDSGGAGDD
jgi:hypothetical protein